MRKKLAADRLEFFSSYTGIDAWSANGLAIRVTGNRFAPYRSPAAFNDEWLSELSVGTRISLDRRRHLWLGSELRSVWNQGPLPPA